MDSYWSAQWSGELPLVDVMNVPDISSVIGLGSCRDNDCYLFSVIITTTNKIATNPSRPKSESCLMTDHEALS